MYRLQNLPLNREGASWFNLGTWLSADDDYTTACMNFALLLSEKAGIRKDDRLLDIGAGCGDQSLLYLEKYQPRHITALNPAQIQVAYASEKIRKSGRQQFIDFRAQRFEDFNTEKKFDRIIALDSAYHLQSKEQFFRKSFGLLEKNGSLAFTDFTLTAARLSLFKRAALAFFCKSARIPRREIRYHDSLTATAVSAGLKPVETVSLDEKVLKGYSDFILRQKLSLLKRLKSHALPFIVTAYAIRFIVKYRLLHYTLFVFSKEN